MAKTSAAAKTKRVTPASLNRPAALVMLGRKTAGMDRQNQYESGGTQMRMMLAAAALAFLVAPASAQTSTQSDLFAPARTDEGQLTSCLLTQEIGQGRDCIGTVSRACAEPRGEGADTSYAVMACAMREESAWRGLLESNAERLRAMESETQKALLDEALAVGADWTSRSCAYAASIYEGGSLARVVAAQCARDATAERALQLHNRLRVYDENF
jgi:uncharacterized protein YecT (DUF1311 family)